MAQEPSFKIKVRGGPPPAGFRADHRCFECGVVWELNFPSSDDHIPHQPCPECAGCETAPTDGTLTQPHLVVRGNHDFSERQSARLYDRSTEHFRREGRDEAIERQRMQFRREGMVQ